MINEYHSHKDFTHKAFRSIPAYAINGTIRGSCFYHELIGTRNTRIRIFPEDMEATFEHCNLDNVHIPAGCTLVNCSNRRIKIQNDLEDWITDEDGNPLEPMAKYMYE